MPERNPRTSRAASGSLPRPGSLPVILAAFLVLTPGPARSQPGLPTEPPAGTESPRTVIERLEDRRESNSQLLRYLADQDAAVRSRATLAIGRIGRAADVGPLAPLLADPDVTVRREAAFALGEIEDSSAAVALEARFVSGLEDDGEARAFCVEGLGKLARGSGAVREALRDPDPRVVAAALHAAWRVPGTDPAGAAIDATVSKDPAIRRAAACCLMRLLGVKPSGRTSVPEVAPLDAEARAGAVARLRELAADPDPQLRIYAARGLAVADEDAITELLEELTTDPDWRVRVEAARALAAPDRAARPHSLRRLRDDRNPNVRITAVEALATTGGEKEALRWLRDFFHDRNPRIRRAAYGALLTRHRASGDPMTGTAIDELEAETLEMLGQTDWSMRALAADGASLLPLDLALPILDRMIRDEPRVARAAADPLLQRRARLHASPVLAQLGPDLERLLSSSDSILRSITIESLGTIFADTSVAVDPSDWMGLEMILDQSRRYSAEYDRVPDVRLAVIEAGRLLRERSDLRRILNDCASDPDYLVRRAASTVLREMGQVTPVSPEPVETGISAGEYEEILRWAESEHWAVLETEEGSIVVRLFAREAPLTCWNFARLAHEGFFDRGRWHRVVPDFVLQDGCPRGDGYGGSDRTIRCEINEHRFVTGAVGMALSGKDTGSSQFFITHSDQPHLDGRYTVFGQVERGMEEAGRITQGANLWSIRVVDAQP